MERTILLPVLLLACTFLESGCFLFKRNHDDDVSDTGDGVVHLETRYWNDDIQPCIEKYCLPYQGKKMYIKCLQHFCPAGLLAVPRDTDDVSLFSVTTILGDTEFCTDNFLTNNLVSRYDNGIDNMLASGSDVTAFKYGVYSLCRDVLCKDTNGAALYECVRDRCCGRDDVTNGQVKSMRKRTALDKLVAPSPELMTRKRRVNDEVSQCIMSYCNEHSGHERVVCIVNKCNRA